MLCVSITLDAQENEPEVQTKVPQKLADAVIEDYVKTNLDNVLRFHRRAKGGMQKGAKVTKILAQGRPEDTDAMGYNILLEYPSIDTRKTIIKTKNVPPSFLLI